MQLRLEDLTPGERAQFEKALVEGDSGTQEWEVLTLMATVTSNGNGEAFERRQAFRALYRTEMERRSGCNSRTSTAST
jgi:hypothetical protein